MTKRERERETKTFRPYLYLSTLALATWMVGTPPVHAAAVTHTSSVEQASAVLQGQQQQKQVIKGTVRDEKGEPLLGVSIMIKSLKKGVTTDLDGNFSIPTDNLQFPEILQFFYVGYKSREVRVTKPGTLDITLAEDVSELNEVVVTGFIAKQKNSYTGSQATVKREELLSVGTKNVFESIAAFVPGMEIVQNNNMGSDPNTRPDINIRGRASFEGSANMPVFVVDGGIVDVDYVYDMDMNDIETVTVLKDAAASALYGAKASAGVIVITTRSLQGGKLRFNYSGTVRLSTPDLSDYDLLDARQKLEYERLAGLYTSTSDDLLDQYRLDQLYAERQALVAGGLDTDWMSKPLRNGVSQNHNLSMEGGDEYARYSVGMRYGNEEGVVKDSGRERLTLNFKLSYNLDQRFYISNSTTINNVKNEESPFGSFSQYVNLNPYDDPYNADGTLKPELSYQQINPLYEGSIGSFRKREQFYVMNNTDLRVWIKPELRLDAMFSFTKHKDDGRSFTSPLSKDELKKAAALRGKMDEDNSKSMDYSGKLMLSYNKYVYKKLYLSAMGGANVDASDSDDATYSTTGYFSDKLAHPAFASRYVDGAPTGSDGIERSVGFFVNVNTMWDEKYFLDVIYRYEGSSKFGKNKRFAPFWSVGGGWNIHKESFMKGVPVELLKLRASVGYTGNVSFSPYQAMTTYQYKGEYDYYKGIGSVPITIGNPDLTWQRTLTTNVGVDLTMFKGRWDLSLDYYIKNTDQLLLDVTKAPSIGVATARENVGSLENKGLEFQTRVIPIRTKDWYWGLSLNFSHNTNKIKKISNALQALNEKNAAATKDEDGNPILAPLPLYEEGQSLTVLKVVPSAGIDPATGKEVFIKRDGSYTFDYDSRDKVVFGDTTPWAYGSMGSYLTWKQLSFNLQFGYSFGAVTYNQTLVSRVESANPEHNADVRVLESRWKHPGDEARFKNIADRSPHDQTSRFVESENYVELKSASLAYEFTPKQLSGCFINRLHLELMTNDLFYISSVKRERGLTYPYARTVEFSARVSF